MQVRRWRLRVFRGIAALTAVLVMFAIPNFLSPWVELINITRPADPAAGTGGLTRPRYRGCGLNQQPRPGSGSRIPARLRRAGNQPVSPIR
jgi:hypothetical protein